MVRGRGRGLGDRGQMVVAGRLSINRLFLSRPHDRIPFHSKFYPMPTDGQAQTNMPPKRLQSWGHKN